MERVRRWYFEPQLQLTPRARRWYALQLYALPLAGLVHALLIPLFALLGSWVLAGFNVVSVLLYALAAVACRLGRDRLAHWMMGAEIIAHAWVAVDQLGWAAGTQNALFLLPLVNGPHAKRSDRVALSALGAAAFLYLYGVGPPAITLSPATYRLLFALSLLVVFAMTHTVLGVLEGTTTRLEGELATARARGEELLKRELSHQVAERSRELGAVLAKGDVTLDARTLRAGERFAERYKIVSALGAGGMGAVYEVERVTDGERLALKAVLGEASGASAARFAREAEIGARVRHPNVVPIVDVGVASGVPFLVMELVRGGSLEEQRSSFGDVAWALPILRQICDGLGALHEAGVVHRDLKPANVLLTEGGAKISDFGISRLGALDPSTVDVGADTVVATPTRSSPLTGTGAVLGTPLYAAPEGAKSARDLDASADVFAFGVLAYEMLTGTAPFRVPALFLAMADEPIPVPDTIDDARVPGPLASLLRDCLAGDPARRPRVRALRSALG